MEDAAVLQSLPDDRHRSNMKRRKQTDHVIFADHIRAKSVQKVKSGFKEVSGAGVTPVPAYLDPHETNSVPFA
jgi:hypothetical protein